MASSVFQGMVQDALSGMAFLPRTLADFQEAMLQSVASVDVFSDFVQQAVPVGEDTSREGADAAARTLFALADAGSGFEKQLQLLNPSVRAVALANEAFATQINKVSVQPPVLDAVAAVPALAGGGQVFSRLTTPFITQGSGLADDVPALLMRDEFVMRQAAVKKYGLPLMYALNNLQVPEQEAVAPTAAATVAAFASGGVVSGSKRQDKEKTWSLTVSSGSVSPENFYHSFSAPQDVAWSGAEASSYAAALVQNVRDSLGIERMREDAQGYLESILNAFKSDSQALRIFASGGSADTGSSASALQQEKNRISEAYAAKIQTAKNLGNVDLTELYELQLNTLLHLLDELLRTLEQLALDYQESVEDALADYEEDFDAIQQEAGEQLAALQEQYQTLAQGSSLISNLGGDADSEKKLQGQTKSRMRSVESRRSEEEDAAEALYVARTERLQETLQSESEYEAKNTTGQGEKEIIEATADLRQTYLKTLQNIRDLEAARDEELAALEKNYTRGTISETAEYLNQGGLVGGLSALGRLLAGRGFSWEAGLPVSALRAYARGGLVSGGIAGRDSVPALLMPGEYVLNKHSVERIGLSALESVNLRPPHFGELPELPRFAEGGLVDTPGLSASQEHLIRFDLGVAQPTVRTDSDNLRSLVRGLKQMQKRMVR